MGSFRTKRQTAQDTTCSSLWRIGRPMQREVASSARSETKNVRSRSNLPILPRPHRQHRENMPKHEKTPRAEEVLRPRGSVLSSRFELVQLEVVLTLLPT